MIGVVVRVVAGALRISMRIRLLLGGGTSAEISSGRDRFAGVDERVELLRDGLLGRGIREDDSGCDPPGL